MCVHMQDFNISEFSINLPSFDLLYLYTNVSVSWLNRQQFLGNNYIIFAIFIFNEMMKNYEN